MNVVDEITKLTDDWYHLIGKDHHKDRDCHWYIETKWSYGYPPKYTVQHWGYLVNEIEKEYDSYEEALGGLRDILKEKVQQEKIYQETNCDEDEW